MISHIFVALGMWDEVVLANTRAAEVADERRERKGLPVDTRNYHAIHWLGYGYLQQGRYDDARVLLERMADDAAQSGSRRARRHLAMMRADYLVNTERWNDGAREIEVELDGLGLSIVVRTRFADGMAALATGDRAAAERSLEEIKTRLRAVDTSGTSAYGPDVHAAQVMALELEATLVRDAGDSEQAIARLEKAAKLEEQIPYEYGPPRVVKPSHELLGEVLLDLNRPREAEIAFNGALARGPRRTASLLGLARAAERSGDAEVANEAYTTLAEIWVEADSALPAVQEARAKGDRE
jgi:tetratricopeptide (TPR) repeat protein